jgi:23S rRNA (cytosine1962-C5)-methyltransferase
MPEHRRPRIAPPFEPDPDDRLPTAYLRPGEADRVIAGHPWIYEGSVLRLTRTPVDGEVVQVKDHRRRFLGVGFFNSKSKIQVRLLSPERVEIDERFLERRLLAAWQHRQRFLPAASSCRVVSAEGDLLSGLIVDKYEDVLVMQMSSVGMDRRKDVLVRLLQRLLRPRAILERNDMGARKFEGLPNAAGLLAGELPEAEQRALPVHLNGLQFQVDLQGGHKTGLYLDQQVNQARVAELAPGARVLDAFTFLGGFALPAARAGAVSVMGIDQSAETVAVAERLAALNGVGDRCRFQAANVFDWLRAETTATARERKEAPFDLIVLDPPSFTRNRAAVPDALRGYKEIHVRALRLLRLGGTLVTFCCSHHVDARTFEATIGDASFDARRQLRRLAVFTQSPDHPILPAVPETEYLKGFAYEVLAP